jgi:hypothetical protein
MKTDLNFPVRLRCVFPRIAGLQNSRAARWISYLLILAMLNVTHGCYYLKVNTRQEPDASMITDLDMAGKNFFLHFGRDVWRLSHLEVTSSLLKGQIREATSASQERPIIPGKPYRYYNRASNNQSYLLNEVHIFAGEYSELGNNMVSVPVESIHKIDLYDHDSASTVGSWILTGVGIVAGVFTLLIIGILLFKESCPFIYTYDGSDYQFAGEIYSGSIQPSLERHDYLKLPWYPGQVEYRMRMTNEVREIQHTNLMELLVIDHPEHIKVLVDKYGEIHTLTGPQTPRKAVNLAGNDILTAVSVPDGIHYTSLPGNNELPLTDGVIMEFTRPAGAAKATIAIRAKNSVFLDYMMGRFHDQFGNLYNRWTRKQRKAPEEPLRAWSLDQGLPLSLFIERNSTWEFVDYYHIAGPMAFREDVLSVPLHDDDPETLRFKLEFGNFFWEIDYVSADFSPGVPVESYTVPAREAFDEDSGDVTRLLAGNDKLYFTQHPNQNSTEIVFDLPGMTHEGRTLFLHSKGWYEVLRNPSGKADRKYLETFRQKGTFNRFTNETIQSVYGRIADASQ